MDGSWFFRPGIWLLSWCKRAGLPPANHPAAGIFVFVFAGASLAWLEVDSDELWPRISVGVAITLQALLIYLFGADAFVARAIRKEVWEQVERLNKNATGHLALILECFAKRHRSPKGNRTRKDAYDQELRDFQKHLLSHALDVIVAQIGDDEVADSLSANWALRGTGENANNFRVVQYNRNMTGRRPRDSNWKPIVDGRPGASTAFLHAKVSMVEDTHLNKYAGFFPGPPQYRSILSIPVDCQEVVIGVVNIDASKTKIIDISHQYIVLDIAYLIGLCEVLRGEKIR